MSKSAIYTAMTTTTPVAANGIIPLGSTIRRFGCNVAQDGNTITITGQGYFLINVSATVAPVAIGNVSVTMLKDGVPVTGATATDSVSTANNSVALPITAIVRNACGCDSSILSFTLGTTGSNVTNFAVDVVKL